MSWSLPGDCRESALIHALQSVGRRFDLAIFDCPPSLGLRTVAALTASDAVLLPVQPQAADLCGLRLSLETLGVLVTFHNGWRPHHRDAVEAVQVAGLPVLPVIIGRLVRVEDPEGAGQLVTDHGSETPGRRNI